MTHAIYIAVILVLAGVVGWLCMQISRTRLRLSVTEAQRTSAEHQRAHAHKMAVEWRHQCNRQLQDLALSHAEYDDLDGRFSALQASNRSLRGWNGRYRRRIAELEAELADERGEV